MNKEIKLIICWLWTNKNQILEDVLLYADTLDPLNLFFVLIYEMVSFLFDQNKTYNRHNRVLSLIKQTIIQNRFDNRKSSLCK